MLTLRLYLFPPLAALAAFLFLALPNARAVSLEVRNPAFTKTHETRLWQLLERVETQVHQTRGKLVWENDFQLIVIKKGRFFGESSRYEHTKKQLYLAFSASDPRDADFSFIELAHELGHVIWHASMLKHAPELRREFSVAFNRGAEFPNTYENRSRFHAMLSGVWKSYTEWFADGVSLIEAPSLREVQAHRDALGRPDDAALKRMREGWVTDETLYDYLSEARVWFDVQSQPLKRTPPSEGWGVLWAQAFGASVREIKRRLPNPELWVVPSDVASAQLTAAPARR